MKFTFYGHSCFAIESAGTTILFDPFISGNELAKAIDIDAIKADYILVSHGHGDHVADLVRIAKNTNAKVVAAYEIISWVQAQGIQNVHPMNYGAFNFDFGKVRFTPAFHSSTLPDGTPGGNPGGFLVETNEGNYYYSGDTCVMMDMQLIPRFANIDFAVLPIGGNFTMDADEALMASDFIDCNKIIGVHFDTFGYIKVDHDAIREKFASAGKHITLPAIGETFEVN